MLWLMRLLSELLLNLVLWDILWYFIVVMRDPIVFNAVVWVVVFNADLWVVVYNADVVFIDAFVVVFIYAFVVVSFC